MSTAMPASTEFLTVVIAAVSPSSSTVALDIQKAETVMSPTAPAAA